MAEPSWTNHAKDEPTAQEPPPRILVEGGPVHRSILRYRAVLIGCMIGILPVLGYAEQGAGTAAVIVPPTLAGAVARALAESGVPFGTAGRDALDLPVTVLTVEDAKGLEFDSVTVVEPSRLVGESAQGLRALYVAFTRATQRLNIVHSEPLPAVLAGVSQHSA